MQRSYENLESCTDNEKLLHFSEYSCISSFQVQQNFYAY